MNATESLPEHQRAMTDDLVAAIQFLVERVKREQNIAWETMPAAFNVENEDILGRFYDDVVQLLPATQPASPGSGS